MTARLRQRLLSSERGFALTELLVVIVLLTIVLGAVLGVLDAAVQLVPKDQEREYAIREGQSGLDRMSRELRQAYRVNEITPSAMDVNLAKPGTTPVRVEYRCDVAHPDDPANPYDQAYQRCLRYESSDVNVDPVFAGATGRLVVDRVLNGASVFTEASAFYVKVRVEVPSRGERRHAESHRIVLDDAIFLRNVATSL